MDSTEMQVAAALLTVFLALIFLAIRTLGIWGAQDKSVAAIKGPVLLSMVSTVGVGQEKLVGLDHRIGHPVGAVPFAKRAKMAQAQGFHEIKPLCKFSPSARRGDQGQLVITNFKNSEDRVIQARIYDLFSPVINGLASLKVE